MIQQREFSLQARPRGFHLVTDEVYAQISDLLEGRSGLANFFLLHTSASLLLTENADPTVRADLERHFHVLAPERAAHYRHTLEGDDDMPAHIKSVLLGTSLSIPVCDGQLALGTWQGICLGEHRAHGSSRRLLFTLTSD